MRKQLNENISFLDGILSDDEIINEIPDLDDVKFDKVSSLGDIVIPNSINDLHDETLLKNVEKKKKEIDEKKKAVERKNNRKEIINKQLNDVIPESEIEKHITIDLDDELDAIKNLSDNNVENEAEHISPVIVETIVEEVVEEINDSKSTPDNIELEDIKVSEKKSKQGYFKTKVSIKTEKIPKQIKDIASLVKSYSSGVISPRVVDLRVIANTNKTQLKNSTLKLSTACVVFKPDFKVLKVNKGTRIMLSVPENYESTGNLLVYIQESRAKVLIEVEFDKFKNIKNFNEYLCDLIANYYTYGYNLTLKKLNILSVGNPMMNLISTIVKTGDFKAYPYTDENGKIYAVTFESNELENQWLQINVVEDEKRIGKYKLSAISKIDRTFEYDLSDKLYSLIELTKDLHQLLINWYNFDWSEILKTTYADIDDKTDYQPIGYYDLMYMSGLITHRKLQLALYDIKERMEENPNLEGKILKVLSKKDTKKLLPENYDCEAIICSTNKCSFVLSYLAEKILGGDKRRGREYIDNQQYYNKYSVKDRNSYDSRKRTILTKQEERNYNSRIYMFQVEYEIGNKKYIFKTRNWDELLNETGILSDNVKPIKSIY